MESTAIICYKRRRINRSTRRNIPECMLFEVLIRLPVKVLFKLKVVSKQWFSMISDPCFARMYVSRASLSPHDSQHWTLIHSRVDHMATMDHFLVKKVRLHECSIATDCLQNRLILPRAAQGSDHTIYRINGVSDGLVLYSPPDDVGCLAPRGRIFGGYICNLITGKCITLPPYKHFFGNVIVGFVTRVQDNVLVSYRVVLTDSRTMDGICRFVVFLSESSKWVEFDMHYEEDIYIYGWKKPVVFNKILHRMISQHRLMAYDPYSLKLDSFRMISLPDVEDEGDKIAESLLDENQGKLRFFVVTLKGSRSFIIWALNDYDRGEWCLQHRVGLGNIRSTDGGRLSLFTVPLSFHPSHPETVYMIDDDFIFCYNINTKASKILDASNKNYRCRFPRCYLYSFLIPTWPTSINSPSFQIAAAGD
ncbi:putative F-box protein At3g23970 [Henckelia pumila]|uniref:putative F-box protein At3g23970 n=1 Tax=Henckelia pumila TaxID=405737 RepID=UPI003C6E070E